MVLSVGRGTRDEGEAGLLRNDVHVLIPTPNQHVALRKFPASAPRGFFFFLEFDFIVLAQMLQDTLDYGLIICIKFEEIKDGVLENDTKSV